MHAADARYHKCNAAIHLGAHRTSDIKCATDDQAFSSTINVVGDDHYKLWNAVDVQAIYLLRVGDILSLHSLGVATLLVFRKHVATNLRR